jgi:hypothetical protein
VINHYANTERCHARE